MRKVLATLLRCRFQMLVVTVLGCLVGFWLAVSTPNTYVSSATFLVGSGGESITVSPSASPEAERSRLSLIENAPYVLLTDELFYQIAEKLGPDVILAPYDPPGIISDGDRSFLEKLHGWFHELQSAVHARDVEFASPIDAALALRASFSLDISEGSVITVFCQANDPRLAQQILEEFMEEAPTSHLEAYSADREEALIEQSYNRTKESLETAESELHAFEADLGITSFPLEWEETLAGLRQARNDLSDLEESLAGNERLVDLLTRRLAGMDPVIERERLVSEVNPSIPGTLAQIDEQERRLTQLRVRFRESDPEIDTVKMMLKNLREKLAQERATPQNSRREVHEIDNPEYVYARVSLEELKISTMIDRGRLANYERKLNNAQARFDVLVTQRPTYQKFAERIEALNEDLRASEALWSRVQIKQQLNAETASSLKVFSPPTYPYFKDGPQRGKLILMSVGGALFLGLVLIVLRAVTDSTVRTREDLEGVTGGGVLAIVPSLERKALRRHEELRSTT